VASDDEDDSLIRVPDPGDGFAGRRNLLADSDDDDGVFPPPPLPRELRGNDDIISVDSDDDSSSEESNVSFGPPREERVMELIDDDDGKDDGKDKDTAKKDAKPDTSWAGYGKFVASAVGAVRDVLAAIDIATKGIEGQAGLVKTAKELVTAQNQVLMAYLSTAGAAELVGSPPPQLTAVDTQLRWDNYLASVHISLKGVTGGGKLDVALTVLGNIAKAMGSKLAAVSSLRAERNIVRSQIAAVQASQQRFDALIAAAATDGEKLAAARGALQGRVDALRRSLFVAWNAYRNSYYYLYFSEPPAPVNLDMSTADLRAAFGATSVWVSRLLGDDPNGGRITLPSRGVPVTFTFPVVAAGDTGAPLEAARLRPATATEPAVLSWTIAADTQQLIGVLPDQGKVAIWITAAEFLLDGVTPNSTGNVLVQVATSGSYTNGYGPTDVHAFVAKSMIGYYGYRVADGVVYNGWNVPEAATMTPTPFTQWTMAFPKGGADPSTAKTLQMKLTITFREAR
jgi:hypothetical protein